MSTETALQLVNTTANNVLAMAATSVETEERLFELAQRKAKIYAQSALVPKVYQNNIGNVLIADNMARRMGADTLMVMQNLYIVHGNPGWSAQFLVACFNSCGRFSAIKYRFEGEVGQEDYGCVAFCTELSTGEVIEGTKITWKMANAEGWVNKAGSKWKTMPEQMFRYRAATFLIRSTAPEIGMGLLTKEEIEDMPNGNGNGNGHDAPKPGIAGVKERLARLLPDSVAATTEGDADFIDQSTLEHPADTEEPQNKTIDTNADAEIVAKPVDEIENLRANVTAALDALPKSRKNDLIAGKPLLKEMTEAELKALLAEAVE